MSKIKTQSIAQEANFYRERHSDNLTPIRGLLPFEKRELRRNTIISMGHFLVKGIPRDISEGTIVSKILSYDRKQPRHNSFKR